MMDLRALLMMTIYTPADAARYIRSLELPREAGWMALLLASIINSFAYFINTSIVTIPEDYWLPVFTSPIVYLILSFSLTVVMIYALFWVGRLLEGTGDFSLLVTLIAWLVVLQSLADFVFIGLLLFVPMLAGLFSLAAGLYGVWILLNFIKVGHGFPSIGKAILTIVLALVALTVGLSVFLSVIGVTAMGIS